MPIELQYRDDGAGVVYVCTGVVTASEFTEANEEVYAEESVDRHRYQLIDSTATERLEVSVEDVKAHSEMDRRAAARNPQIAIAVVGPKDATYGISRMWQAHVDESEIRIAIFRSIPESERWLEEIRRES